MMIQTEIARTLFGFSGRMSRVDWWTYAIFVMLVGSIWLYVIFSAFKSPPSWAYMPLPYLPLGVDWRRLLLMVPVLWPIAALSAKRLQDRELSGGWLLIAVPLCYLTVFTAGFWILVELGVKEGMHGPNRYGPSPNGLGELTGVDDVFS